MNPVAYDIGKILENEGIGTFGTDIFASKEPDQPDNCITVYNTGGFPDECLDTGISQNELCNFQVRVRNNDYLTAYTVMTSIRNEIEKAKYKTITDSNGVTFYSIWATSLPIDLQRDTTNRCIVVQNYSCLRYLQIPD